MSTDYTQQHPTRQGPQPPFPQQKQESPGLESEMQPRPDYGEESYQGSGRLHRKSPTASRMPGSPCPPAKISR